MSIENPILHYLITELKSDKWIKKNDENRQFFSHCVLRNRCWYTIHIIDCNNFIKVMSPYTKNLISKEFELSNPNSLDDIVNTIKKLDESTRYIVRERPDDWITY